MNLNFLLSDDIFISYSRWDASTYAPGLADKLINAGFSCFIDRYGTDPNRDLPETLKAKIRSCKMFVLIATERAAGSEAVEKEIREFQQTGRASRIIPIDVDGSLGNARWYDLVAGIAAEPEKNRNALDDGDASDSVVSRIEKSFNYTRGKQRLRRATVGASLLLVALLAAGGWASVYALGQLKAATQARAEADKQKQAATEAETRATQAGRRERDAEARRLDAVGAKTKAEQLRDGALTARDEAARQRAEAEKLRDAARVEAQRQGVIAESGREATNSQALLRQKPIRLIRGVSVAIDSLSKAASAGTQSVGADSALRESVALLPRYFGGEKYDRGFISPILSPDGQHFAALTKGNKLEIFSVANANTPLAEVACDDAGTIAISNGGGFAALEQEKGVRIFDVKRGQSWVMPIQKGEGEFLSLALSPKGKYLAAVYRDRSSPDSEEGEVVARLFDAQSGKVIIRLSASLGIKPNDVAFGPNGNLAMAGVKKNENLTGMGGAAIWDLAEGWGANWEDHELTESQNIRIGLHEQESEILSIAPGLGHTFATYTYDQTTVWKPGSGRKFEPIAQVPISEKLAGRESMVEDLAFSPDGARLVIIRDLTSRDNIVGSEPPAGTHVLETWEASGYWEAASVLAPSEIKQVGFRPGGVVAVAEKSGFGGASVYRSIGGEEVIESRLGSHDEIYPLKESSDARIALVTTGSEWQVWDYIRATKVPIPAESKPGVIECVATSADGKFFAATFDKSRDGAGVSVAVYMLTGGSYHETRRMLVKQTPAGISISPDGRHLVLLNTDGTVEVRNPEDQSDVTPNPLRGLKGFDMIRIGPTGRHLVTSRRVGSESVIEVWSLVGGREVMSFKYAQWVPLIEFSPGERFLLSASEDSMTRLLDLKTLRLTTISTDARVYAAAFSADERYYATGSIEGVLRVSLTASPETEVAHIQHRRQLTKIAFSEDNRFVASASGWELRVFFLRPQDLIDEATARLNSLAGIVR